MADLRGREGCAPLLGSKFFQFHAVFGVFLAKSYGGAPPPPKSWWPHLEEILDPPLRTIVVSYREINCFLFIHHWFRQIHWIDQNYRTCSMLQNTEPSGGALRSKNHAVLFPLQWMIRLSGETRIPREPSRSCKRDGFEGKLADFLFLDPSSPYRVSGSATETLAILDWQIHTINSFNIEFRCMHSTLTRQRLVVTLSSLVDSWPNYNTFLCQRKSESSHFLSRVWVKNNAVKCQITTLWFFFLEGRVITSNYESTYLTK